LNHTSSGQTFVIDVGFEVIGLEFDPELWILSSNNQTRLREEVINSVLLYPNPTQDRIVVEVPLTTNRDLALVLTDASGRVIHNYEIEVKQWQPRFELDLRDLPTGVYFLEVPTPGGRTINRVVKY